MFCDAYFGFLSLRMTPIWLQVIC